MEQEDDIEVELHFSCGLLVDVALNQKLLQRWAPTNSYKWRYNPAYKWPSKWRTGINNHKCIGV